MRDFGNLNKLVQFCREIACSVEITYWEASDELEIRVISSADSENYYEKRIVNVDTFIQNWRNR